MTEAPAVTLNSRDGVVAEVQLVQGCEAVEGAAVHFHQAVVLQVPTETQEEDADIPHCMDSTQEPVRQMWWPDREGNRTERRRHICSHSVLERKFKHSELAFVHLTFSYCSRHECLIYF